MPRDGEIEFYGFTDGDHCEITIDGNQIPRETLRDARYLKVKKGQTVSGYNMTVKVVRK